MLGRYTTGDGAAHQYVEAHDRVFGCRMVGTFNVDMPTDFDIREYQPVINVRNRQWYWLVRLTEPDGLIRHGWATRWKGSDQSPYRMEILTKAPLPDSFKGGLRVKVCRKWSTGKAREWADGQYWFQSWPWTPQQKAPCNMLWKALDCVEWGGRSVLDIGCNAGYYAFQAAKMGARCFGFDPSAETIEQARVINEHIECQDVQFDTADPGHDADIILYLSVHHQRDSDYSRLAETLDGLRKRTHKHLFVELIIPPSYGEYPVNGKHTEADLDAIVSGTPILRYPSPIRGTRKLWRIDM